MNIIIPVETPNRELIYKSQLASHLAHEGFDCYLTLKKFVPELVENLSPCIYFDKGFHPGVSEKIHKQIKDRKGFIVSLDEEGAVDFPDFSTLENRYSETLFRNADLVFMWGKKQRDHFQAKYQTLSSERVIVSGHPRFDHLIQKTRRTLQPVIEKIRAQYDSFILVNLNCGFGNNIKGDAFVRENYGPRVRHLAKIMAYDKFKLEEYLKLIRKLCAKTSHKIVVRPHPEESLAPYQRALRAEIAAGKCVVTTEHSVLAWNAAAEFIIHPDCTSAVEAVLQGKRPISFLPEHPQKIATQIPVDASTELNDIDSVLDAVSAKGEVAGPSDVQEKLQSYFHLDGQSEQNIVSAIKKLNFATAGRRLPAGVKLKLFLRGKYDLLAKKRNTFVMEKQKGFNLGAIRAAIESSDFKDSKITTLATDGCFLISHG